MGIPIWSWPFPADPCSSTRGDLCGPCAGVLAYVYIGSLANDVGEIIAGRTRVSPTVTIVSAAVSGVFIIGAMVMITLYARRAIRRWASHDLVWVPVCE